MHGFEEFFIVRESSLAFCLRNFLKELRQAVFKEVEFDALCRYCWSFRKIGLHSKIAR